MSGQKYSYIEPIVGGQFDLWVKNQLDIRTKRVQEGWDGSIGFGNRSSQVIQWLNSNTGWIRMSSFVEIGNGSLNQIFPNETGNSLAKKNILQAGTLVFNEQAQSPGLAPGFEKNRKGASYQGPQNLGYNKSSGFVEDLGFRPMAGITGVEIKSLNRFGTLREATINFKCFDLNQLEVMEILYMRPGFNVLLEWGHSLYFDNNNNFNNNIRFINIFDNQTNLTNEEAVEQTLEKYRFDYNGNYDGMLGYITNYGWTSNSDGTYDCYTKIISKGDVIESLKINTSQITNPITDNPKDDTTIDSRTTSAIHDALILIGQIDDSKNTIYSTSDYPFINIFRVNDEKVSPNFGKYFRGDVAETKFPHSIRIKTNNNIESQYKLINDNYISLKHLTSIIVEKTNNILKFDPPEEGYACLTSDDQISFDPSVCLVLKDKLPFQLESKIAETGQNIGKQINIETSAFKLNDLKIQKHLLDIFRDITHGGRFGKVGRGLAASNLLNDEENNISIKILRESEENIISYNNYYTLYKIFKPKIDFLLGQTLDEELVIIKEYSSNLDFIRQELSSKNNLRTFITNITNIINENKLQEQNSTIKQNLDSLNNYLSTKTNTYISEFDTFYTNNSKDNLTISESGWEIIAEERLKRSGDAEANLNLNNLINSLESTLKEYLTNAPRNYTMKGIKQISLGYWDFNYKKDNEKGNMLNIWFNINYLLKVLDELSNTNENHDVYMYDFFNKILDDANVALGGINEFAFGINKEYLFFQDRKYINTKQVTSLEIFGLKSIVRNYSYSSKITNKLATTIAISAQTSNGGNLGIDDTSFSSLNKDQGIINKFNTPISLVNNNISVDTILETSKNILGSKDQRITQILQLLSSFYGNAYFSSNSFIPEINISKINGGKESCKRVLNSTIETTPHLQATHIVPIEFSFEIDGISGIKVGQSFEIPSNRLPFGYRSKNGKSLVAFIVTGIDNKVSNNTWTTNIRGQMVKKPKQYV